MADAYARVSGRVGVCEGPSGGGATYLLPGVVEANESSVPLLAVTTDIATTSRGRFTLTELDQQALFRPVTKWNRVLDKASAIPAAVRQAFTQMTTGRPGAVHLGLPYDVQKDPVDEDEIWADATLNRCPSRRTAPEQGAVEAAAALLRAAASPVFICGGGAIIAGAERELQPLAERLGAPVATTISGKGSIAEDHPLAVGVVGSNGGTPETRAIVAAADLVVFVGCRAGSVTTERWRHPAPGTPIIHIDVDPAVIGANYKTEVGLVGDARLSLVALNGELERADRSAWGTDAVARAKREKFEVYLALAQSDARPIRPERIVLDLEAVLPEDAVIIADPGTPCPYLSAYWRQREAGRRFISNRAHGEIRAAVEGAAEGDHRRAVGVVARDLHRVLQRLGAGREEDGLLREVAGRQLVQPLRQLDIAVIGDDLEGRVREFLHLLVDGRHHLGVAVAGVEHRDAAGEVDVALALHIP